MTEDYVQSLGKRGNKYGPVAALRFFAAPELDEEILFN